MIAKPGIKIIQCSADNAIEVTSKYTLNGALSKLRTCWMRLGHGKDTLNITWVSRFDCRGNFKTGHVVECLKEEDIPKSDNGENVYCQFMAVPESVIDEKGKSVENYEAEILLSEIVQLDIATFSRLANAARYNAVSKDTAKAAPAPHS